MPASGKRVGGRNLPILLPYDSVNHRLLLGPAATPLGSLDAVGTLNSLIAPPVVILPILLPEYSVNHRFSSGPAAMSTGKLAAVGTLYSAMAPPVVIRQLLLPHTSGNHGFTSGLVDGSRANTRRQGW